MPNTDSMEELVSTLKEWEQISKKLSKNLLLLYESLDNGDFVPYYQVESIHEQLDELQSKQIHLSKQYKKITGNKIPTNYADIEPDLALISGERKEFDLHQLITIEDKSKLSIHETEMAHRAFRVKQFEQDMETNTVAKVFCFLHGSNQLGFRPETVTLSNGIKRKDVLSAAEELYNLGYFKKCEIEDLGYMYAATSLGIRVLKNKDTRSFIKPYLDDGTNLNRQELYYEIESANHIKLSLLAMDIMDTFNLPQFRRSFEIDAIRVSIKGIFFLLKSSSVVTSDKLCFISVITDEFKDFDRITNVFEDLIENNERIVVSGYTKEYIDLLGEWLIQNTDLDLKKEDMGYYLFHDPTIYSLDTDQPMDIMNDENGLLTGYQDIEQYLNNIDTSSILIEKNPSSYLSVESPKAKYNFNESRFMKEMRGAKGSRLHCMIRLGETGIYKVSHMETNSEREYEELCKGAESLFELGYVAKHTVSSMDSFYTLTKRGLKAFESSQSASFLQKHAFSPEQVLNPFIMEIKDSNMAKLAVVMFDAIEKMARIDDTTVFEGYNRFFTKEYYNMIYADDFDDIKLYAFGIVTDDQEAFLSLKDELLEQIDNFGDMDYVVVSGVNVKQAKAIANLAAECFELPIGKDKIYYTACKLNGIYNLASNKELKSINQLLNI